MGFAHCSRKPALGGRFVIFSPGSAPGSFKGPPVSGLGLAGWRHRLDGFPFAGLWPGGFPRDRQSPDWALRVSDISPDQRIVG